jgi:HPt (histidine-containing phosphotransfer) domain-containing protein
VGDIANSSGISAIVFMLFVVAGSAYIMVAKLIGIGQIYVTLVPVLTMVGYALLIWLARSLRLRDDQAGDNLYYMGFLFTLTSLGVSLYQFNASRAAEEIVQNFGIAIGSTITGVALRVVFNQMRQDPVEVERIMRLELADAARRVRRELDSTAVEFGYVRRSAQQAASDSFIQVSEKIDEIASKLLARIAQAAAQAARSLDDASHRSAGTIADASSATVEALAATARQLEIEMERLSKGVAGISTTIKQMTKRLEGMPPPDPGIAFHIDPVIQSLTVAVDRLSAQADRQTAVIRDGIEAVKGVDERLSTSLAALRAEVAASSAASSAALNAAMESNDSMTRIINLFNADAWEQVELLRHLLERIDSATRTFTEAVVKSGSDMTSQTQGICDLLLSIQASAETLAVATERVLDFAKDSGSLRVSPNIEVIR